MEYKKVFTNGKDSRRSAKLISILDNNSEQEHIIDMCRQLGSPVAFVELKCDSITIHHHGAKDHLDYEGNNTHQSTFTMIRKKEIDHYICRGAAEICDKFKGFCEHNKSKYMNPLNSLRYVLSNTSYYDMVVFI